jgi:hypothetical protein
MHFLLHLIEYEPLLFYIQSVKTKAKFLQTKSLEFSYYYPYTTRKTDFSM